MPEEKLQTLSLQVINGSELESGRAARCLFTQQVTATSDLIQLRQGDEIQIGRLMVRVHLNRGDIP